MSENLIFVSCWSVGSMTTYISIKIRVHRHRRKNTLISNGYITISIFTKSFKRFAKEKNIDIISIFSSLTKLFLNFVNVCMGNVVVGMLLLECCCWSIVVGILLLWTGDPTKLPRIFFYKQKIINKSTDVE